MPHKIVTSPANAVRKFFLELSIDLKVGQCSEVLAAMFGFTTLGALASAERSDGLNCDAMLDAEWVVLDTYKLKRRLTDFGLKPSTAVLQGLLDVVSNFWTGKRHPKRAPRFHLTFNELLASPPISSAIHLAPSGYFQEGRRVQIPSDFPAWIAHVHPGTISDFPPGVISPNYGEELKIRIDLKLLDEHIDQLSPHNRAKLPDGVFGAYLYLYCVGPRGLDYGDIEMPEDILKPTTRTKLSAADEKPAPQIDLQISPCLVASPATEPAPHEELEEEELDEDEEEDNRVPEGALCENDDNPAVASTEYGYLCEDCYEQYVDGYIRD